ncbi:hypothetical protein I6F09_33530 [Bradyrhizobium sp. IC3195]|uniref:hypothetical protein n=1 Tax=Bradyrhizobium sp. IC3195 TaxID=2793804 RepID=UPI001CD807F2|nr:hypothetical protein [Bradyrhizobium sp. IC3195]MCA1472775.1 hypothetical protein [Bradyrhizobium sp. IC3195]
MNTLKATLPDAFPNLRNLSGAGRTIDRDRLALVLDGLAANLKRAYWIRLLVGTAIFLVLFIVMIRYSSEPTVLAATVAATGATVGGTIRALKQVTEEMARVGLLLAITPEVSIEALTEIAKTVVAKL